jgi:hypothetical protein
LELYVEKDASRDTTERTILTIQFIYKVGEILVPRATPLFSLSTEVNSF